MAERRMFAKTIIDSDAFIDMPVTARLLYYDLSMRADDDGFVNSPKKIMRMIGASEDDMRILCGRKFIIPFDNGVVVIKHWRIHNYIRKDTYHETPYKEEKQALELDENNAYRLVDTSRQRSVDEASTKVRLGKVRLGKVSEVEEPRPLRELELEDMDAIQSIWNSRSCTHEISNISPMSRRAEHIRLCISACGGVDEFLEVIRSVDEQHFFTQQAQKGRTLKFDWFVDPNNFQKIIEGNYRDKYSGEGESDGYEFDY